MYSIIDVSVHHKTRFIGDFFHGICKCEDPLGIHKATDGTNLNEVTLEEYETICWDYDLLPGHQIRKNCTAVLFYQTESEEKEVEM